MPYIPLEKLNEPSKPFIDEYAYYANKFCPGEKKTNTQAVKRQMAKAKITAKPKTNPASKPKVTRYFSGLSICISAWKTAEYIEECLDSIASQTWLKNRSNYEIIIGIDGCEETLGKVKEIMHKYKNIRVYMMSKNVGTYVTCNTIMKKARFEWIMRFDSDDVMPENMLEKIFSKNINGANVIKYRYRNFGMKTSNGGIANGSHIIKNSVWNRFGGYRNWQISADYDLLYRIADKVKTIELGDVYYNRRTHMNSLMNTQGYEMKSELRKKLDSYVVNESRKNSMITCVTEDAKLVYDATPKLIVSFTTWKKRQDAVVKMIEHFRKQTVTPDKIYCYLSSDEYGGENTPPCLQKLVDKKLIEIKWVKENTYCHKRHEVFKEHYNDYVFIIDDDILYDANYIADMYNAAVTHPDNVICYTGSKYEYEGKRHNTTIAENPSIKNSFLGGVCCFPPHMFPMEDYFGNLEIRQKISPKCDSSYLHIILIKSKTKVFLLHDRRERWINVIPYTQHVGVWEENKKIESGTNINHMEHIVRQLIDAFGIKDEFRKIYPKFK